MNYDIDYTILCSRGKVRAKNQDNFWFAGTYLDGENDGLAEPIESIINSGENPVFAVFDGMGGEKHGEIAAYLAAKTFDEFYPTATRTAGIYPAGVRANVRPHPAKGNATSRFFAEACRVMNNRICAYTRENRSGDMGSTAAIIGFGSKEVHLCNIGDSKIFRFHRGKLAQISFDHIMEMPGGKKTALSQYLGIPEDDFIIEPYTAQAECINGDRYLLCTDGLTDMVAAPQVERILQKYKSVPKCAEVLLGTALANGGNDNITVVLCEVLKSFSGNNGV